MARLQDFQSVTPSGSDNLLIVQSQGQGLSTLNAVGQKVATETTMSSLNTTSKNLVGGINEVESGKVDKTDFYGNIMPMASNDSTKVADRITALETTVSGKADKTELVKYFDLTANVQTADSGISPYSYCAQPEKTDANIHNILAVSVYDTRFNNPAIAVFYGQSGSTYKFMIYSARTGNVKIRVVYN